MQVDPVFILNPPRPGVNLCTSAQLQFPLELYVKTNLR